MGLGSSRLPKGRLLLSHSVQMSEPGPRGPSSWDPPSQVTTSNRGEGTRRAGRPPPSQLSWRASGRDGAHVCTHARTLRPPRLWFLSYKGRGHVGPFAGRLAREAARERAAGCVSRRRRVTYAAREAPLPHGEVGRLPAAAASGATMDTASHSLVLLQQLNMQREFGFLCDCTVAIGDVYFKAHRAVLAAFSNYFKMIFIHQTRKRKISCTICGHKFLRKSQLLEHMYTHKGFQQVVLHKWIYTGLSGVEERWRGKMHSLYPHLCTWLSLIYSIPLTERQSSYNNDETKI
uniref:Zinc finger and BTB domain containing 25 n=1 Tax=Bos mutus grunniens TaxID=30521 RepID=A0A8B9XH58_BOSMU